MMLKFHPLLLAVLQILVVSCVREPLAPQNPDEDLYQRGQDQLSAGDYGLARSTFQKLRTEYPASDRIDNAILGQAEAERGLGFRDSAVYTLREMPKGSSYFGTSLLKQGTYMLEDVQFWPADSAVVAFRQTIRWDGDQEILGEAWYSLGQSLYKMVGSDKWPRPTYYDSALVAYHYVRENFYDHARSADALYRTGWVYYQKSNWSAAADSLLQFAEEYPSNTLADGALYWAAKARGNAHQDCAAISVMNEMLETYPFTDNYADAKTSIAGWTCEP